MQSHGVSDDEWTDVEGDDDEEKDRQPSIFGVRKR